MRNNMAGNFAKANALKHEARLANPSRPRHLLREAVRACGSIKIIGFEYMIVGESYTVWYDAAVTLPDGRMGVIFLFDTKAKYKANKYNMTARQRKIEYAKANNIPFLEVWPSDQTRFQANIELWLITIKSMPYREAPPFSPKRNIMKTPKRSQRLG